jgi:hypothetical protein
MSLTKNLDQYVSDEIIIRQQLVNQLTSMGVTATTSETINELIEKVKTITLIGTTTSMGLTTTSCHYGASITVTGTLDDANSNPLKTKKLYLYAGERQVAEAVTDDNGLATFTYVVDEVGSLSLKVKYLGSNNYTASESASDTLTVSKADTVITLTADPSTVPTGESTTLTVTLKDEWGNDLVGEAVEILDGSTVLYNGIIDETSKKYSLAYSPSATITLNSKYEESTNYNTSTSSNNIITVTNYLFYDTCADNAQLNSYGSSIAQENGASLTLTHNSGSSYHTLHTTGQGWSCIPITSLNGLSNLTFETEFSGGSTTGGLIIAKSSYTHVRMEVENNTLIISQRLSGSDTNLLSNSISLTSGVWYKFRITLNGTSLTYSILNNDSIIKNGNVTINSIFNTTSTNYYGLLGYWDTSFTNNIRNVKAYYN